MPMSLKYEYIHSIQIQITLLFFTIETFLIVNEKLSKDKTFSFPFQTFYLILIYIITTQYNIINLGLVWSACR